MSQGSPTAFADVTEGEVRDAFESENYVADDEIVTTVALALRLGKPLLVEGQPGAGKTELAKVLAAGLCSELVRLQCYEGLTAESALYEWNYTKQLLAVQANGAQVGVEGQNAEAGGEAESPEQNESIFSEEYLLERPLLRALRSDGDDGDATERPPVLLIDEVDRADEAFEALLLEVLSEFQVTVPELGTVRAATPPVVVVTSNRTRGLSDALKRRCLFLHVEPPSFEKERAILERKVPELDAAVAAELCAMAGRLREEPLLKPPGAAETIDWARAVAALRTDGDGATSRNTESDGMGALDTEIVRTTLGCVLKEVEDTERVDEELLAALREAAADVRREVEP